MQGFDYDMILQEIVSFKMGLTIVYYVWYIAYIESYHVLCVMKTIEQTYGNIYLSIRKLIVFAF